MPRRIVQSLCHRSDSDKVKNKQKTCHIPLPSLAMANIAPSEFNECWKAYMDTQPTDEQLESLFKIGCWNQPQHTKGNRVGADMVKARANFVQEVVVRGRAVERPPVIHHTDGTRVCLLIFVTTTYMDCFPSVCVSMLSI